MRQDRIVIITYSAIAVVAERIAKGDPQAPRQIDLM
jgi:hypothetical protein